MCGITGFFAKHGSSAERRRALCEMTARLAHRGPDAEGHWMEDSNPISLGHRRLAIIDVSEAGAQPMLSHSGRFVIAFNGEMYNFAEMRSALEREGVGGWRGASDTEVLLEALEHWGIQATLERMRGMFAFALWDRREGRLVLTRDRLGEKPLYCGWQGSTFLFGSELKALAAHPSWKPSVEPGAISLFLRYGYLPAPWSPWQGIRKVMPGTWLELDRAMLERQATPREHTYWSLDECIETARSAPFAGDEREALDMLDSLLRDVVREQMVSDVPLGALLSGGIDSSCIAALMQAESKQPVKTFTIGFCEDDWNEAPHARAVAASLGTEHHEIEVRSRDALAIVPEIARIYDEPFADSSQIPTVLVSRLARAEVTVALSGDGGDETFGGYNRYVWVPRIARRLEVMPRGARRLAARLAAMVAPQVAARGLALAGPLMPGGGITLAGEKYGKLVRALDAQDEHALFLSMASIWQNPDDMSSLGDEPTSLPAVPPSPASRLQFREWMMRTDALSYLPDDILAKVDRAAMSTGLETRVPFLDPRVVEFAWRLPLEFKIRGDETKRVLRALVDRYVPNADVKRPKAGFAVPIGQWLRGPLREWAEDLLSERSLQDSGLLKAAAIRSAWKQHLTGNRDRQHELWAVLMLQAWLREWNRGTASQESAHRPSAAVPTAGM